MTSEHSKPPVVAAKDVAAWRERAAARLVARGLARRAARLRVRVLERSLRELATALEDVYGTPHLGNWSDPTDELVYIILSRKTAERAYLPSYATLKAIGSWDAVAALPVNDIAVLIRGGGLEMRKAVAISAGLRQVKAHFGCVDLIRAGSLGDRELFDLLSAIPEVGPKSARCVMLFSFGRPVFPVDAHVGRVFARLGTFQTVDVDLASMDHRGRQNILADAIPPDLRYGLHVNLVAHGRSTCSSRAPRCPDCTLANSCVEAGGRWAIH